MKKNNNGFSLVELIIVIAIMAVLVGVLAPQFIKYVEQSRRSRDIQTAQEIREACLADIADGVITGGAGHAQVSASTFTSVTDNPVVAGNLVNHGGKFYASWNSNEGSCHVFADGAGSTWDLTLDAVASAYKTAS